MRKPKQTENGATGDFHEEAVEILWMVEYQDTIICPCCKKKIDILKAYFEGSRCPICAQLFHIEKYIT